MQYQVDALCSSVAGITRYLSPWRMKCPVTFYEKTTLVDGDSDFCAAFKVCHFPGVDDVEGGWRWK